jgi:Copper transport outer membrane protein, MctB
MINFRFHVVSIVAVFLALAVGVVFGSTIVDQAIVDQLRADVRNTENEVAETKDLNEQLKSDLERWRRYVESDARYAVEGRLDGDQIVLVVERGVDNDLVDGVVDLLEAAGVTGTSQVLLDDSLVDDEQVEQLATIVGSSSRDPIVVRAAAYDALAEGLATQTRASDAPTTGAVSPTSIPPSSSTLDELAEAGFIELDAGLDALLATPKPDRRSLVLATTDSEFARYDELASLAGALDAVGLDVAVGEEYRDPGDEVEDPLDRGARLAAIANGDLADRVATVDNLDEVQGRISLTIALSDLGDGLAGHYGFGTGATRSAPEWSSA